MNIVSALCASFGANLAQIIKCNFGQVAANQGFSHQFVDSLHGSMGLMNVDTHMKQTFEPCKNNTRAGRPEFEGLRKHSRPHLKTPQTNNA